MRSIDGLLHEILTPVTIIQGALEYSKDKRDSHQENVEMLEMIEKNYSRLHSRINDLLKFFHCNPLE